MNKEEIVAGLQKLNIANSQIERETGFAKNNLGKYLRTPELLSDRWIEKFQKYIAEKESPCFKEIENYCIEKGIKPELFLTNYKATLATAEELFQKTAALSKENEELRQQIENAGRTLGPRKRTLKTDAERQEEAGRGLRNESEKPQMPKGLNISQQIEWRANNP